MSGYLRQRRQFKKAVYYFSICLKFRECQPTAGVFIQTFEQIIIIIMHKHMERNYLK